MKEIELSAKNFHKAVTKLEQGIEEAEDELDRDGIIQRFEFTFELFWKTLKLILEFEGWECKSPRSCLKQAFRHEYIDEGEIYLDMLEDRNRSTHIYKEEMSKDIFERVKNDYLERLIKGDHFFQKYSKREE